MARFAVSTAVPATSPAAAVAAVATDAVVR
jgi:hypothetical protein